MHTVMLVLLMMHPQKDSVEQLMKPIIEQCLINRSSKVKLEKFTGSFAVPNDTMQMVRMYFFQQWFDEILKECKKYTSYELYDYATAKARFKELADANSDKNMYVVRLLNPRHKHAFIFVLFENGRIFSLVPIVGGGEIKGWI